MFSDANSDIAVFSMNVLLLNKQREHKALFLNYFYQVCCWSTHITIYTYRNESSDMKRIIIIMFTNTIRLIQLRISFLLLSTRHHPSGDHPKQSTVVLLLPVISAGDISLSHIQISPHGHSPSCKVLS